MNEAAPSPIFCPEPLVVTRLLSASRDLVFKAWTHADHVRNWFAPHPCTAPSCEIDFRPGGQFNLTMQLPDGTRHEMRAAFTEIDPPSRVGFAGVLHSGGRLGFRFDTVVRLTAEGAATRLEVTQTYEIYDEAFRRAVEGAREGWNGTLDNLEREAAALSAAPARTAEHSVFTVRRALAATPERVFRAFVDLEAKARWFSAPKGFELIERTMDVRVGGRERVEGRHGNGMVTAFEATYFDVVLNERLIYAYEMRIDGKKISVSLATLVIAPDPKGALLTITEQGVFIDGYHDGGSRESGTNYLLDAVERSLEAD